MTKDLTKGMEKIYQPKTWEERFDNLPQTGMTTKDFISQELAQQRTALMKEHATKCCAILRKEREEWVEKIEGMKRWKKRGIFIENDGNFNDALSQVVDLIKPNPPTQKS